MKAKKALKRLHKVETLLSTVIDQFPDSARGLRDLLGSARSSIVRARETVNARVARAAKKPPAKASESHPARLSAEGRKRISLAAKRRWALAKQKGIHAVTGRKLRKTA
ncbi:MAG TPA: hypothetical protein VMT32_09485 [Bryobacteraceae bacterium]|nr:hypothetical protein [Bryobacteraceae bacterium]